LSLSKYKILSTINISDNTEQLVERTCRNKVAIETQFEAAKPQLLYLYEADHTTSENAGP